MIKKNTIHQKPTANITHNDENLETSPLKSEIKTAALPAWTLL